MFFYIIFYINLTEKQNFLYKELQKVDRELKSISKKYPNCCVCYKPDFDLNKASQEDEKGGSELDLWYSPREEEFYCICIKDTPTLDLNIN